MADINLVVIDGKLLNDPVCKGSGRDHTMTFQVLNSRWAGGGMKEGTIGIILRGKEKLAQYLQKETKVTITGELAVGNSVYVEARDIVLRGGGKKGQGNTAQPKQDDEIPF